jgi:hypothetical protein
MEGAAAQAEQQHRLEHSHRSNNIAAAAHTQQHQHRAMDAKASRGRRGGRTGKREKEEHIHGEADGQHGRGSHGGARPGQATPHRPP